MLSVSSAAQSLHLVQHILKWSKPLKNGQPLKNGLNLNSFSTAWWQRLEAWAASNSPGGLTNLWPSVPWRRHAEAGDCWVQLKLVTRYTTRWPNGLIRVV